jgi:DNA invertase Pin-like site-specific DNA recombinase
MMKKNAYALPLVGGFEPQPVLIYCRDSGRGQKENLRHQKSTVKRRLEEIGFRVVRSFGEIAEGWKKDRPEFRRAVRKAKATGLLLVAESLDRFWRPPPGPDCKLPPMNSLEFKRFLSATEGVRIAVLDPSEKARSEQTKRGQEARGHKGGRPKETKKKRRERLSPIALKLSEARYSYRRIGRELKVPWRTVRDWIFRGRKPHGLPEGA